jgi:hypothetical protein
MADVMKLITGVQVNDKLKQLIILSEFINSELSLSLLDELSYVAAGRPLWLAVMTTSNTGALSAIPTTMPGTTHIIYSGVPGAPELELIELGEVLGIGDELRHKLVTAQEQYYIGVAKQTSHMIRQWSKLYVERDVAR